MKEIIRKPVNGFPCYWISPCGSLISFVRGTRPKHIKAPLNRNGYPACALHGNSRLLHRIVAETWLQNPDNHAIVNHLDGDKTNCHVTNLEWCTSSVNQKHAYQIGLRIKLRGSSHGRSVLTQDQVIELRGEKNINKSALSRKYGISRQAITDILSRKNWSHI